MTGQLWHGQTSNTPAQQAPANELHPTRFLSRPMFGELDRWPTLLAPPLAPGGLLACHGIHRSPVPRAGQTARPGIWGRNDMCHGPARRFIQLGEDRAARPVEHERWA